MSERVHYSTNPAEKDACGTARHRAYTLWPLNVTCAACLVSVMYLQDLQLFEIGYDANQEAWRKYIGERALSNNQPLEEIQDHVW